ncbi:hypothetical protein OG911_27990 [Streptomyces sp. NBC_00208]|uniref:hypothetical protein n=1 Tax=Streptomyces sp. NBC_00208 TaxID=2975681 RepID=UPI002E2DFCA4|nr:hypothetical protein [Streptomyces sp. NBC_00208]
MARVRYIGAEPVTVPELGNRTVQPDEMVEVPDARWDGYVGQTATWEAVDEPKADQPAPKKMTTAAKTATSRTES